ncbi:MAG: hypothetical protein PHS14_06610 [Elusimicrobia bacterium]|nr:hypothetical protein [Elusimicrobiota bacterium]
MAIPLLLGFLLALAGDASAAVRPLVMAPGQLLAPSAPVVLGLGAVATPALTLTALTPSLVASPALAAAPAIAAAPTPALAAARPAPAAPDSPAAPSAEPLVAGGPRWISLLKEARQTTAASTRRIMAMRGAVKVRAELATSDTKTITEYNGAPSRVSQLDAPGRIYRHWVLGKEAFEAILEQGALRAGPVSYVEFTGSKHAFIKDIYVDIQGSFFTTPEHSAAEPRVMNQAAAYYVDFRLPEGVSALSLDGDDVMVIPAAPGTYLPIEIVGSSARD